VFFWPHFFSAAEIELRPNPVVGNSERAACKSKKGEGLWKPRSERPPSRASETAHSTRTQSEWSSEVYSLCAYLFMLLNFKITVRLRTVDAEKW